MRSRLRHTLAIHQRHMADYVDVPPHHSTASNDHYKRDLVDVIQEF